MTWPAGLLLALLLAEPAAPPPACPTGLHVVRRSTVKEEDLDSASFERVGGASIAVRVPEEGPPRLELVAETDGRPRVRAVPLELPGHRHGLVAVHEAGRSFVAIVRDTDRDDRSRVEVLRLGHDGRIAWRAELGEASKTALEPRLVATEGGLIVTWIGGTFSGSFSLSSARIDRDDGRVLRTSEVSPRAGFRGHDLVARAPGAIVMWSDRAGASVARLDPEGVALTTRRFWPEDVGLEARLVASPDVTLAVGYGGSAGVKMVLLEDDLRPRASRTWAVRNRPASPVAAWTGEVFVLAWSEGLLAREPGDVWAVAVDSAGRSTPKISVTEGSGGYLYAADVRDRKLVLTHTGLSNYAGEVSKTELSCVDAPLAPVEPCELDRRPLSPPLPRSSSTAIWAMAGAGPGWQVARAVPGRPGVTLWRVDRSGSTSPPTELSELPVAHSLVLAPDALAFRDFDQHVWLLRLDPAGAAQGPPIRVNDAPVLDFGGPCLGVFRGARGPKDTIGVAFASGHEPRGLILAKMVGTRVERRTFPAPPGPVRCGIARGPPDALFTYDPAGAGRSWGALWPIDGAPARRLEIAGPLMRALQVTRLGPRGFGVVTSGHEFAASAPHFLVGHSQAVSLSWFDGAGKIAGASVVLPPRGTGFLGFGLAERGDGEELGAVEPEWLTTRRVCPDRLARPTDQDPSTVEDDLSERTKRGRRIASEDRGLRGPEELTATDEVLEEAPSFLGTVLARRQRSRPHRHVEVQLAVLEPDPTGRAWTRSGAVVTLRTGRGGLGGYPFELGRQYVVFREPLDPAWVSMRTRPVAWAAEALAELRRSRRP